MTEMPKLSVQDYKTFKRSVRKGIEYIPNDLIDGIRVHVDPTVHLKPSVDWALRYGSGLATKQKSVPLVLLTPEQEKGLFLYYNDLRFSAKRRMAQWPCHDPERVLSVVADIIIAIRLAEQTRNRIIDFNMGLITNSVNYYCGGRPGIDRKDLYTEGCHAMFRIVDCFNINEGTKFSTYTFRSLFNCYNRFSATNSLRNKRQRIFSTIDKSDIDGEGFAASIEGQSEYETRCEMDMVEMFRVLTANEANLTPLERKVIDLKHFTGASRELTWPEISRTVEVSRERAREIYDEACLKLQSAMKDGGTAIDG